MTAQPKPGEFWWGRRCHRPEDLTVVQILGFRGGTDLWAYAPADDIGYSLDSITFLQRIEAP
jgi:hypothetical protein